MWSTMSLRRTVSCFPVCPVCIVEVTIKSDSDSDFSIIPESLYSLCQEEGGSYYAQVLLRGSAKPLFQTDLFQCYTQVPSINGSKFVNVFRYTLRKAWCRNASVFVCFVHATSMQQSTLNGLWSVHPFYSVIDTEKCMSCHLRMKNIFSGAWDPYLDTRL